MSSAEVGDTPGAAQAALVGAPMAPTVSCAKVCGTDCMLRTVIVSTSLPTPVLAAKAANFCSLLTSRWVLAPSGLSTVSYAKAALFCILLAARWVLAPTDHGKKHKIIILSFSLSLPL
jgi:hypothetical protein